MAISPAPILLEPTPRKRSARTSNGSLVLLATPAVLWYLAFTIGPLIAMFVISTFEWRSLISKPVPMGLDNFGRIFADPVFAQATVNSFIQLAVILPIMIPVAFMIGYYISLSPRGHGVIKTALFTPALISLAAKSMIFLAVFSPNGLFNGTLKIVGLGEYVTAWLASPQTAYATVIFVELWAGIGFTAVLFSARLGGLPREVLEAATIDGAGHWTKMWAVAYPIVKDYFGILTMLQFTWILFSSAGTILLLTQGGPGYASTNLSFLIYDKAFVQSQIGYSQAVGVVIFVVGVLGILVIRRVFRPAV